MKKKGRVNGVKCSSEVKDGEPRKRSLGQALVVSAGRASVGSVCVCVHTHVHAPDGGVQKQNQRIVETRELRPWRQRHSV